MKTFMPYWKLKHKWLLVHISSGDYKFYNPLTYVISALSILLGGHESLDACNAQAWIEICPGPV